MDERDTNELLVQAREDVLARANTGREKILSAALAVITSHTHEASIPTLLASLTAARGRLHRLLIKHGDIAKILQHVRKLMRVDEKETSETILSSALTSHTNDKPRLRYAAEILSTGSKTDIERAKKIQSWLDCDKNPKEKFELYADAFLTAARYTGHIEIRKSLVTKKIKEANPDVKDILEEEANRLANILTRVRSAIIVETTEALLHFSDALLTSYQKRKEQHSLIDYDDLIQETGRLLNREGIAPWVLFKLDGGIDHVLIDEAQDTSPEQWGIIKALVDEFTVGNSAQENERTVFSVGDLKQSIYSFQGADPG
jgi:ATP-dependent helicase/nuclease subunit A